MYEAFEAIFWISAFMAAILVTNFGFCALGRIFPRLGAYMGE